MTACPKCGTLDASVLDSRPLRGGAVTRRRRWCINPACCVRWTTMERLAAEPAFSVVARTGAALEAAVALMQAQGLVPRDTTGSGKPHQLLGQVSQGPPTIPSANPPPVVRGGVGGGLSSGSGPDPVRTSPVLSDPDPTPDRDQEANRARGPAAVPQAPAYRMAQLATNTQAFLRVYHRFPNKVGKSTASQVFRELAVTYEGGEDGLSAAIVDAFARGMLKRRPYLDEKEGIRFCPALERFLERRLWEDEIPTDAQPQQASIYRKLGDE